MSMPEVLIQNLDYSKIRKVIVGGMLVYTACPLVAPGQAFLSQKFLGFS